MSAILSPRDFDERLDRGKIERPPVHLLRPYEAPPAGPYLQLTLANAKLGTSATKTLTFWTLNSGGRLALGGWGVRKGKGIINDLAESMKDAVDKILVLVVHPASPTLSDVQLSSLREVEVALQKTLKSLHDARSTFL